MIGLFFFEPGAFAAFRALDLILEDLREGVSEVFDDFKPYGVGFEEGGDLVADAGCILSG